MQDVITKTLHWFLMLFFTSVNVLCTRLCKIKVQSTIVPDIKETTGTREKHTSTTAVVATVRMEYIRHCRFRQSNVGSRLTQSRHWHSTFIHQLIHSCCSATVCKVRQLTVYGHWHNSSRIDRRWHLWIGNNLLHHLPRDDKPNMGHIIKKQELSTKQNNWLVLTLSLCCVCIRTVTSEQTRVVSNVGKSFATAILSF